MSRPSNRKSIALTAFLLELSGLSQKYGFRIEGPVDYEGYKEDPYVIGNGVHLALIYDESRQEYSAV
jgi:hypothetical protein